MNNTCYKNLHVIELFHINIIIILTVIILKKINYIFVDYDCLNCYEDFRMYVLVYSLDICSIDINKF